DAVDPRQSLPRPREHDRRERAVRVVQDERRRVLDVAALAFRLAEQHARRGSLHAHDVAGDRPREVDLVAAALEDVAAALRPVEEPGAASRRAYAAAGEQ